ncbi:MAG: peptidoglycan editing factor PgeF [Oscillospiraceae bacterium]|nr:peptidoglycan editing factor PgeF [Oscillospiraceae bacterium]
MIFKSNTMNLHIKSAVGYLTFKKLEEYKFIRHAFSTRLGGISKNEYKSMNLRMKCNDQYENIIENYKLFCKATNIDFNSLTFTSQTHSNNVRLITLKDVGVGIHKPQDMDNVDALITNEKGITLVTFHADCIPIFVVDPVNRAIGLAHSGWRGTSSKITENLLKIMKIKYSSLPENLICCIGPGIGKSCFETDLQVIEELKKSNISYQNKYIQEKPNNRFLVDLPGLNKQILLDSGVNGSNISVSDLCTKCSNDLLFSYRQTGDKRGTMAAMLRLC